jgi:WD40 repeat protein
MEPHQPSNEECTALAFHPSGLHLLVGLTDKIICYNVRGEKLFKFKEWNVRGCCDIKFSHGGHLFAAVAESK